MHENVDYNSIFMERIFQIAIERNISMRNALIADRIGFPVPTANTDEGISQYLRSNMVTNQKTIDVVTMILQQTIPDMSVMHAKTS